MHKFQSHSVYILYTTLVLSLSFSAAVAVTSSVGKMGNLMNVCGGGIDECQAEAQAEPHNKNSAFVFVKPHENTWSTQNLVRNKLTQAGISILSESDVSGETIDEKKLIDQHYYAIASKATILPARDIPVPTVKFEEAFGETWETVLCVHRACNAMEACQEFKCDAAALNEAW